jgi:group II intron reverse transcriptase/maturase
MENLKVAFNAVKKNKGCPGVDDVTIAKYESRLGVHLTELRQLLLSGVYQPLPVKQVLIPKSNGKYRPLGIPAIRDRIVQQAILQIIQPLLDPGFSSASFGFRPNKSAIQAVETVQQYLNQGYEYVVDADISDFFGTLHHQILMDKVRKAVSDDQIRKLIFLFLKAGIMEEGKLKTAVAGTPQGGVISPLLANLYLNSLDERLTQYKLKLVRYADDFVILCDSELQAKFAMYVLKGHLRKLRLSLAPEKTQITTHHKGFDFLGYHFHKYYGTPRKWPKEKSQIAFKEKVKKATRRLQPKNVKMVIEKLNPIIRGWGNYFKHGDVKKRFNELDGYIRMRLRSFIAKQKWPSGLNWKYPNDHFVKLGLVSLTSLLVYQQQLSFSLLEQPYRKAVCGKSARTV